MGHGQEMKSGGVLASQSKTKERLSHCLSRDLGTSKTIWLEDWRALVRQCKVKISDRYRATPWRVLKTSIQVLRLMWKMAGSKGREERMGVMCLCLEQSPNSQCEKIHVCGAFWLLFSITKLTKQNPSLKFKIKLLSHGFIYVVHQTSHLIVKEGWPWILWQDIAFVFLFHY